MITPSAGLRWSGQPICWDAAATSGMWANLIAASKDMNATGIAVSTRPDQRAAEGPRVARAGASSVASIDRLLVRGRWSAPTSRRQTRPGEIDNGPIVAQVPAIARDRA